MCTGTSGNRAKNPAGLLPPLLLALSRSMRSSAPNNACGVGGGCGELILRSLPGSSAEDDALVSNRDRARSLQERVRWAWETCTASSDAGRPTGQVAPLSIAPSLAALARSCTAMGMRACQPSANSQLTSVGPTGEVDWWRLLRYTPCWAQSDSTNTSLSLIGRAKE